VPASVTGAELAMSHSLSVDSHIEMMAVAQFFISTGSQKP
jgi:hypothetical protein